MIRDFEIVYNECTNSLHSGCASPVHCEPHLLQRLIASRSRLRSWDRTCAQHTRSRGRGLTILSLSCTWTFDSTPRFCLYELRVIVQYTMYKYTMSTCSFVHYVRFIVLVCTLIFAYSIHWFVSNQSYFSGLKGCVKQCFEIADVGVYF